MHASRVAVVAVMLLTAGCGGERTTPARSPQSAATPDPVAQCRAAGDGWQSLHISGDYRPPAARLGSGRLGVAVAVFETVGSDSYEADETRAVAAAVRRAGAQRIALVGASVGARAVLQLAAQHPRDVVGVVALSAERRISSNPNDLLPTGRRIQVPVLSIGSRHDPLTSFGKDTLAWHRTIPDDRALVLPGSGHGVEFLTNRHRRRVRAAISAFLRSL
jgi:pimeloyl-ACP methyl ester carboxylesterase